MSPAQRLDRNPGQPQIGRSHGLGGLGEGHGNAVVGPEHLGGALRGQLQGLAVGILAGFVALAPGGGIGKGENGHGERI